MPAVLLQSSFMTHDGYGSIGEYLAVGLARLGIDLDLRPIYFDRRGLSEELLSILRRGKLSHLDAHLIFGQPPIEFAVERLPSRLFINTMWEADRLPRGWSDVLNKASAVFVPLISSVTLV